MAFIIAGENTQTSYKIYVPFWQGALVRNTFLARFATFAPTQCTFHLEETVLLKMIEVVSYCP